MIITIITIIIIVIIIIMIIIIVIIIGFALGKAMFFLRQIFFCRFAVDYK